MPFTNRKLNITHINTQDMPGGASKSTMRLAEMQRRDGHHVSVLVGRKNADFEHYFSFPLGVDPNLQAHCRQAGQLYYEFQGSYQLLYHPLIQDADIVHFHNLHGGYFNPYSISALSHFKPVVWTLRDMQSITGQCAHSIDCNRWKTGCGRCPYLFVYPRLSIDNTAQLWRDKKLVYEHSHLWIVAISRWMMDKIKESILKDHPAAQIYNLSDPSVFKPSNKKEARKRYGIPENKFVIGAAANGGTLNNLWKGGAYSLAAIEILTSKHPEIVFVNIGTSLESTNSKIINIPHLNREKDMAEVYATLDLFLYTPRAETFSLVVLEALSCGIPVVTFKTGGVPEILRHGTDGYVVEFQDIWGLVRHVELLISDPKLHAQFCLNARERAISKFDQDNIYEKYMNYYERCIKEHPLKSRTLKSFPIDMVPDIIKTRAFLNSEKFKSTLKEKKPFLREGLKAEQAIRPEPRTENKYVPIGFGNTHTDKRLDGRFLIIENLFSERKAMQIERNAQADIAIINEEGESLFKKGNFAGALNAFTQALGIDPNTAVTHNNLGVLYYNQGDKEKSFKHYELASILAPENIIYQKNLADFNFIELGRTKEALEIYLKILKDNPTDLETLLILGHICGSLNKFDDAKVFYNKVLEIEPWNMDARERLDGLEKGIDDSLIGGFDDWGRDGGERKGMDDSLICGFDDSKSGGGRRLEYSSVEHPEGTRFTSAGESETGDIEPVGEIQKLGTKAGKLRGADNRETSEKMYQDAQELIKNGREKDGIDALERLLKAYPDFGLAHNDLGVLYYNDGDKEKALKHYEQAAELEPDNSIFKKNLADFYYVELGEIEKSLLIYFDILDKNPEDLETLLTLGNIYIELKKADDAIDCFSKILEIDPDNVDAVEKLRQLRKLFSEFCLDISCKDLPGHYMSDYGKGHRKILASSLKNYSLLKDEKKILNSLTAKINTGMVFPEAVPYFLASMLYYYPFQIPMEFNMQDIPDWFQEDYCKFLLSYPSCFTKQGEIDNYCRFIKNLFAFLYRNIQEAPESKIVQKLAKIFIHKAKFIPLYFSNENLKDVYVQRAEIAEFELNSSGYELDFVFPQRPLRQNKIRFGIYAKAIASCSEAFATFPVYEYLNREEFEIFFYVHQRDGNPTEKRAQKLANKFTELPKDLKNSVDIIRADDLDVLFFSNSLTAVRNQAFILASHRLARFQCVHFCQPVTSGLKHIDFYFLGSMIQENGKAENHYSEQPVRLDGSGICFDIGSNHAESTASIKTDQIGIQDKNTVFVSGANFYKIIPELRHLWAKLLAKVPDSVLILYPFGSRWSNSYPKNIFIHNIEKVLLQYGIENERLIILDPLPTREDIMELLRHTDIYLDAVPYSGATSLLDPLEVGVPPIVMEGEEMRCCQGAAILKELGVDELVVHSEEEYLELAGRLAIENEFRTDLRQTILNRMQDKPPFLDPKGYARKISTALKNIVNSQTSV